MTLVTVELACYGCLRSHRRRFKVGSDVLSRSKNMLTCPFCRTYQLHSVRTVLQEEEEEDYRMEHRLEDLEDAS